MKVFFEEEYLLELYRDGKTRDKHHRYQPSIVKKYQSTWLGQKIFPSYGP